jgi:hypothetical protein
MGACQACKLCSVQPMNGQQLALDYIGNRRQALARCVFCAKVLVLHVRGVSSTALQLV